MQQYGVSYLFITYLSHTRPCDRVCSDTRSIRHNTVTRIFRDNPASSIPQPGLRRCGFAASRRGDNDVESELCIFRNRTRWKSAMADAQSSGHGAEYRSTYIRRGQFTGHRRVRVRLVYEFQSRLGFGSVEAFIFDYFKSNRTYKIQHYGGDEERGRWRRILQLRVRFSHERLDVYFWRESSRRRVRHERVFGQRK